MIKYFLPLLFFSPMKSSPARYFIKKTTLLFSCSPSPITTSENFISSEPRENHMRSSLLVPILKKRKERLKAVERLAESQVAHWTWTEMRLKSKSSNHKLSTFFYYGILPLNSMRGIKFNRFRSKYLGNSKDLRKDTQLACRCCLWFSLHKQSLHQNPPPLPSPTFSSNSSRMEQLSWELQRGSPAGPLHRSG